MIRRFGGWMRDSGAAPWVLLFLVVNLGFHLSGGTNPDSRFALLSSLAEDGTLAITSYRTWTSDWARGPDGRIYSNKPPAPTLLAFPLYKGVDALGTVGLPDRPARDQWRYRYKARLLKGLSVIFQLVPFALLLGAAGHVLGRHGVDPVARDLALLALAFGNTSALFMSTFFGHGFTAAAVLAFGLAWLENEPFWAGLTLGLAVCSDYGSALLVPAAALAFAPDLRRQARPFLLGALGPAVLWIAYHQLAFGSPLAIAPRFQNPEFVESSAGHRLWGILRLPDLEGLARLVAGPERGLLFTNPWILILLPAALVASLSGKGRTRSLARFCVLGLAGLLFLNAGFNGWHGGLSPGPRYLSAIFPAWALLLGLLWPALPQVRRRALVLTLAVSTALALLVFSADLAAPPVALWPFYFRRIAAGRGAALRLGLLLGLTALAWLWRKSPRGIGWWSCRSSESA